MTGFQRSAFQDNAFQIADLLLASMGAASRRAQAYARLLSLAAVAKARDLTDDEAEEEQLLLWMLGLASIGDIFPNWWRKP